MKLVLIISLYVTNALALSVGVGDEVKCRGYLLKEGEKIFYVLEGKILSLHKNSKFLVYGHSPVLGNKVLHKVKKESCVNPRDNFDTPDIKMTVTEDTKDETLDNISSTDTDETVDDSFIEPTSYNYITEQEEKKDITKQEEKKDITEQEEKEVKREKEETKKSTVSTNTTDNTDATNIKDSGKKNISNTATVGEDDDLVESDGQGSVSMKSFRDYINFLLKRVF